MNFNWNINHWNIKWNWAIFWILSFLFFVWVSLPFFNFKKSPPPNYPDSKFQKYSSLETCMAKNHSKESCTKAVLMLRQYTIADLPMYKTKSDCEGFWNSPCLLVDTGINPISKSPVIVSIPPIKGYEVFWDKDTPVEVRPLFQKQDWSLGPKTDDSRINFDNPPSPGS